MENLDPEKLPRHVAVIMDGNGRWAERRGMDREYGHIQGVESIRRTLRAAVDFGIKYLTIYAFSTENWNRPKDEVHALMELLCKTIAAETDGMRKEGIRMRYIGNLDQLSAPVRESIMRSERETINCSKLTLIVAVNYSARWEITQMVQKVAAQVRDGGLQIHDISASTVEEYLTTSGIPDPDLLIRTSGELRLSNFLLWQLSYSELYFTDTLWPDFDKEELLKALLEYQRRERRYGALSAKK